MAERPTWVALAESIGLPELIRALNQRLARALDVLGRPQPCAVRTVTASDRLTAGDDAVWVDSTGGAVTLTAPAAARVRGKVYWLQRSAGANAVTFAPDGAETVNGSATLAITTPVRVMSNGADWRSV